MKNLYEVISYDNTNYKFSMGSETYFVPHFHREIEFGMILDGCMQVVSAEKYFEVNAGEFWLLNSCQCHEIFSANPDRPYIFLELQISPSFFKQYFSRIDRIRMCSNVLTAEHLGRENYQKLRTLLFDSAISYFRNEKYYELTCAGNINYLLECLLQSIPYLVLTDEELRINNAHMSRIQRITNYIDEHYSEKLLLSDLADKEGLTLNYLSHFFKDYFGMPFQTYLQRIRCQQASTLLLETDYTLSDVSLSCGFSALKYMNSSFEKLFGYSPKEYRLRFHSEKMRKTNPQSPENQNPGYHFFPPRKCLEYLEHKSFL